MYLLKFLFIIFIYLFYVQSIGFELKFTRFFARYSLSILLVLINVSVYLSLNLKFELAYTTKIMFGCINTVCLYNKRTKISLFSFKSYLLLTFKTTTTYYFMIEQYF